MKNPLLKRLPREFIHDFGKYLVIFLFMTVTIGFISGFLVASNSMIKAYDESFEKYNIEYGHFILMEEASRALMDAAEEQDVEIYDDFYLEEDTDHDKNGETDSTLRIFYNRQERNKVCLMDGELPEKENEIAIDRMYADNNGIKVGQEMEVGGKTLKVTGLVALSDYSALFSDTTDMMFDAVKFGVALMTKEGFDSFDTVRLNYSYCWYYGEEPEDEIAEKEVSDELLEQIAPYGNFRNYIPRYANSAIHFTGDDMGGDRSMMLMLLYILIVILAFVFAITMSHTISKESAAIGTLRALGYTRGELLQHYLALPIAVTFLAAVIGNILGYTVFKDLAASLYYHSYSLPTYVTIWNMTAFLLTTVVPLILMFFINAVFLMRALRHTPLQFIRNDIGSKRQKRQIRLPDFSFIHRFRIRVILQNIPNYITLFIGILLANVLLLFGLMMKPLLNHYQAHVVDNMLSDYQYILKAPAETGEESAEKYGVTTLKLIKDGYQEEDITTYGIQENSRYVDAEIPEDGVVISNGFAEKFRVSEGDEITLREAYGKEEYTFTVDSVLEYPAVLSVFMSREAFAETFDKEEGYFNGYFSTEEITDIEDSYISTIITEDDLTKTSRQLDLSMGNMFYLLSIFAIIIFVMLIYLLTKIIIEKNAHAISMAKILGYENREIAGLYLLSTTWVVLLSIVLGTAAASFIIEWLYFAIMKDYNGWLSIYIDPMVYGKMFLLGIACYILVAITQFMKIRRIPMDEALKNVE